MGTVFQQHLAKMPALRRDPPSSDGVSRCLRYH